MVGAGLEGVCRLQQSRLKLPPVLWEWFSATLMGKSVSAGCPCCWDGSLALAVILSETMTWSAPRMSWPWVLPVRGLEQDSLAVSAFIF